MWEKLLPLGLVLIMVLSFTACVKEPSVQEIVDNVTESQDEIKSHKFDVGVSLEMAGEADGEAVELTMEFDLRGSMDIDNKQIETIITGSVLFPGEDITEIALEIYIINGMPYIMTEIPGEGPMWRKGEFSEKAWAEFSEILGFNERQVNLLQAADISVIGSEEIKGVDCYVLQLTPNNMEQLWKTALEETDPLDIGVPAIAEEVLREAFANFSVKQWVTKDTHYLTKSEIDISMEMTPEVIDALGGGSELAGMRTMNIDGNWLFYDYNQPVSIVLPPEAKEAIEVPME